MYVNYKRLKEVGYTKEMIKSFITSVEKDELTSIKTCMIYNNNESILDFSKKPYNINDKQLLFSITKSITSLAIGVACDKGLLKLSDKLITFFSDKISECSDDNLKDITIEDLLTMTSGIHEDTYEKIYKKSDWISGFLEQEFPHKPGTFFRYSTHGSHMLSAIIHRVSKQSLSDFVNEYIFTPLDIEYKWEVTPDKITTGGMGLSLDSESVCKLGSLFINKGTYKNKRIISEEYIRRASKAHIYKSSEKDIEIRENSGKYYGYHIHIGIDESLRFDGAFGQVCVIFPDLEVVIAITSVYSKLENLLTYIHKYLKPDKANKEDTIKELDLTNFINDLTYDLRVNNESEKANIQLCFKIDNKVNGIDRIIFKQNNDDITLKISYLNKTNSIIKFDLLKKVEAISYFVKDTNWENQKYYSLVRRIKDTLHLEVYYLETPYLCKYILEKNDEVYTLKYSINKSFTQKSFSVKGVL